MESGTPHKEELNLILQATTSTAVRFKGIVLTRPSLLAHIMTRLSAIFQRHPAASLLTIIHHSNLTENEESFYSNLKLSC